MQYSHCQNVIAGSLLHEYVWVNLFDHRCKKPSEKPHERANLFTIKRLIATYTNVSIVAVSFS
jgi:hypothetical protein